QLPQARGVVPPCPPRCHLDMAPTPQRLAHQQLVTDPLPRVLVVRRGATAPACLPPAAHFAEELLAGLVEADHWGAGVVRQQVGLAHVLQAPDELGIRVRRDAPGLDDPGLAIAFFSASRTVSRPTRSTRPRATSSSANSCTVQWQRPTGGSLHASSTRR